MGNSAVEDYGSVTIGTVVNLRIGVGSDPLADVVAAALAIPLRELLNAI